MDAKASEKPAIAPDLVFAFHPSQPALAIIGMGQKHSPCVLREVTLQIQEGQNCNREVSLCLCLVSSIGLTPFGASESPPGLAPL